jgi:hypothetical protein
VGPQGSDGTLNRFYSAGELLKALVSNEQGINLVLWYRLVGVMSYCISDPFASGITWYVGDSPHLSKISTGTIRIFLHSPVPSLMELHIR